MSSERRGLFWENGNKTKPFNWSHLGSRGLGGWGRTGQGEKLSWELVGEATLPPAGNSARRRALLPASGGAAALSSGRPLFLSSSPAPALGHSGHNEPLLGAGEFPPPERRAPGTRRARLNQGRAHPKFSHLWAKSLSSKYGTRSPSLRPALGRANRFYVIGDDLGPCVTKGSGVRSELRRDPNPHTPSLQRERS